MEVKKNSNKGKKGKLLTKIVKSRIFAFVLGVVIFGFLGAGAATYFASGDVSYDNSESGLKSTDVQSAIDELYNECFPPTATDTITNLLQTNPNELYKDENGDIRYYGASPNNYVSFNNELWRIIGVIDGKIKIIRNKNIGYYYWNSNGSSNWNDSDLKSYLNGDYYNGIKEPYKNMISTNETFYLGDPGDSTASDYYYGERGNSVYGNNPTSTSQSIGLMYPSDYGYAAGSSCLSTTLGGYGDGCYNSDYLFSGEDEWLQTPSGGMAYVALFLDNYGNVSSGNYNVYVGGNMLAVRPVLYLTSTTQITGGDGTSSSPFQLANWPCQV